MAHLSNLLTTLNETDKWMQKASDEMEKKGTEGEFTDYCGGEVTDACIERGLNSPSKKRQKQAQFAKAARSVAKKNKK